MKPSDRLQRIKNHFKLADPVIFRIVSTIEDDPLPEQVRADEYFIKLCENIIGQQLSGKAADTIIDRFYNLFPDREATPDRVLSKSEEELRKVGVSWAKARYIRDLAEKVSKSIVILDNLHTREGEAVIEELIKVKGIGRWTAEMFLIFTLGRENVFSHGDLGLNKAIQKLYGFSEKPTFDQVSSIVEKWTPYKSYGSLALWKSLDNR